ncbi:Hypothetical predicted protein [Mytilus galloprovincialis]|uniref:DZIP3-like HEPN domain-containing protein n=1 Tax=Mytilus galloprovincialis TaxID=29158 RepID=A0A8B6CU29_MYTGA|nr:Hypothetical predicted protein [Mytilus galloprovincialis]
MASSSALTQEEENYVRMSLLLTGISPRAVRVLFDKEFPPASLSLTVNDKKVKQKLHDLRGKRVINNAQWDLLFHTSGTVVSPVPTKWLVSLTKLYSGISCFLPVAVLRIGGNAMKQECDHLMTKPLDMSSQEILRDLNQAKVDIELIKQTLDTEVKQDIKKMKLDHDKSKKDMKVLTFGQANLKRSHNLLQHKQNVSNQQAKRFKKDVNRLELDQINVKVDVKKLIDISEDPVPWNRRGTKNVFNLVFELTTLELINMYF